jgi:hypothetical protein
MRRPDSNSFGAAGQEPGMGTGRAEGMGRSGARPKRGYNATWVARRIVSGVVYATSMTDEAWRIRHGEGLATNPGETECSAPRTHGERSLWGRSGGRAGLGPQNGDDQ